MADFIGASITGVKAVQADLLAMEARVTVASIAAVKKVQRTAITSVRSGMRGRPRYDQRGPIGNGGAAVNLHLSPSHVSRGGGPGQLTGSLRKAVGGVRKPKVTPEGVSGGIGVGGSKSLTQIYRKEVESKYPYMSTGVNKAKPKYPAIWAAAWAKATETKK